MMFTDLVSSVYLERIVQIVFTFNLVYSILTNSVYIAVNLHIFHLHMLIWH